MYVTVLNEPHARRTTRIGLHTLLADVVISTSSTDRAKASSPMLSRDWNTLEINALLYNNPKITLYFKMSIAHEHDIKLICKCQ